MATKKAHVSEKKKQIVKDLAGLLNKKTTLICSIKNLKASQFQSIKKKLREIAVVKVAKKSLIDFALEHAKNEEFKALVPHITSDYALIFSDEDAFKLSGILADNKTPAKAREGQEATEDIWVKAGPTSLAPGPDISALSAVGLQPKVEGGKIAIAKDTLFVKKGEAISAEKVSILAKLDITPFEIGLEPIAAFSQGKVYVGIKIDKKGTLEDLLEKYSRSLAFAVSVDFLNKETMPFILGKAASHENALKGLIKEEVVEEKKEEPKVEEIKEEASVEEAKVEEKPVEEKVEEVKSEEGN
jgi:large subunit ribosomal protein L10